jgi:hypothetical protein
VLDDYVIPTEENSKKSSMKKHLDYASLGGGRMTPTMDRYNSDWNIVKRGWDAHVLGKGRAFGRIREPSPPLREDRRRGINIYRPLWWWICSGNPVGPLGGAASSSATAVTGPFRYPGLLLKRIFPNSTAAPADLFYGA